MTDSSFIENEDRRALRKAVSEWASNYGAEYYLQKARAHEHTTELWSEAGKLGFLGVNLPEEYGGGGAGMYELSLVMEEITWPDLERASFSIELELMRPDISASPARSCRTPQQWLGPPITW